MAKTLEQSTWAEIAEIAGAGTWSEQGWKVGDTKTIIMNGQIGDSLTLNNYSIKLYIIGFDHNIDAEKNGYEHSITFGFGMDANGNNVAICESGYGSTFSSGVRFNMNASTSANGTNSGGWASCHMRNKLLGSTNVNGVDAPSDTATNPLANTFMAALPEDLRAVMRPVVKYTDNVGGGTNLPANVSTTVDYLPLLAEYEVYGVRYNANSYEQNHQQQYVYYQNDSSNTKKKKVKHSSTSTGCWWWLRSCYSDGGAPWRDVESDGAVGGGRSVTSGGVAPILVVSSVSATPTISFKPFYKNDTLIGTGTYKFRQYSQTEPVVTPQLAAPTNVSVSGTTVSYKEVENATSYDFLVDGVIIGEYSTVTLISFSIAYSSSGVSTGTTQTYQAEEGMTWEQWVNSSYNTDGCWISTGNNILTEDQYVIYNSVCAVSPDDSIQNDTTYYADNGSGGNAQ